MEEQQQVVHSLSQFVSSNFGNIAAALARAQGAFPAIAKDRTVRVRMKSGGEYTFSYATLDSMMSAVRPVLAANELALTQLVAGDSLRTLLLHPSGEWIAHSVPLSRKDSPQEYGSELSYKRRYSIVALLCLAADEDDDGNASAGNAIEQQKPVAMPTAKPSAKIEALVRAVEDKEKLYKFQPGHRDNARRKYAGTDVLSQATEAGLQAYSTRLDEVLAEPKDQALADIIAQCHDIIEQLPEKDRQEYKTAVASLKTEKDADRLVNMLADQLAAMEK